LLSWCGPCRKLGPIAEEYFSKAGGKWLLAKVNVDENGDLSGTYAPEGIPQVYLFQDGKKVSGSAFFLLSSYLFRVSRL